MDTVVTSMTSTEGQLKELEKQALQLQRIAEEEAQAKRTRSCAKTSRAKPLKRKLNQHKHLQSKPHRQTMVDKLKKKSLKEAPKKEEPKKEEPKRST